MAGFVFIISIPTEEQEKCLIKQVKKKVTIEEKPHIIVSPPPSYEPCKRNGASPEMFYNTNFQHEDFKQDQRESMEQVVRNVITRLEIINATWTKTEDGHYYQVIFPIECADRCEEIIEFLKENNIGKRYNSIVNVIPCTIHYHGNEEKDMDSKEDDEDYNKNGDHKSSGWNLFLASVRARLTVAQVVEHVKTHAAMTFDFVFMLLISTLLCALGLVENNSITMLSSMLISPMMGPVMAGTFGSVIRDKHLQKVGVYNELIGLGIATLVGFCFGTVICLITDRYGTQDWPTYEMYSRGELRSLWVGCLMALLAGAAVAVGILSDNIASLVGVAISTSLMPPAVNAGLLWSLATVYYFKGNKTGRYASLTHTDYYSTNSAVELFSLGAVSICLTFVNIVCIYVAGIMVFKIKEVALPIKDHAKRRFFKHDIKIARDYNRTFHNGEANNIIRNLPQEIADYHKSQTRRRSDLLHYSTDLSKDNIKINIRRPEYTWSPCMLNGNLNGYYGAHPVNEFYTNLLKNAENLAGLPTFPVRQPSNARRLSQIFLPTTKEEEVASDANENRPFSPFEPTVTSSSQQQFGGRKKFIVTPTESDPLIKK